MSVIEHAVPPKRNPPRKPRRRKAASSPRTLAELVLRLVGPLWSKWYGAPIVVFLLVIMGVWHVLSAKDQSAFLAYLVSQYQELTSEKFDVVVDDLDHSGIANSDEPRLYIFRQIPIQLQRAFEGTSHTTFVNSAGARVRSKFILKPIVGLNASDATVTLELHDGRGGLINTSEINEPIEFFEKIRESLGAALLHDLDFDKYTLTRTHPLARHKAKPEAYALFLEAQELESKNARARPAAIDLMREAVESDKDFATGFSYLAALLQREGKKDEADVLEAHANELDPDHPRVYDALRNPVPRLLAASEKVQWEPLGHGVKMKVVNDRDYDIHITAWLMDPARVALKLSVESDASGDSVREVRKRENAILAVNGGFFEKDIENHLTPTYALKVGGTIFRPYRGETVGGALAISGAKAQILTPRSTEANWMHATDLLYSKPLMLEPGRRFAMIYNDFDRRSRTAVCTTSDGRFIVVVISGGVSLFELAEFLSDHYGKQGLPCDAALALTGGPATQASFSLGDRTLEIQGTWPVYDALVVTPR